MRLWRLLPRYVPSSSECVQCNSHQGRQQCVPQQALLSLPSSSLSSQAGARLGTAAVAQRDAHSRRRQRDRQRGQRRRDERQPQRRQQHARAVHNGGRAPRAAVDVKAEGQGAPQGFPLALVDQRVQARRRAGGRLRPGSGNVACAGVAVLLRALAGVS